MNKRLAWEKNWLLSHGWTWEQVEDLERRGDETPVEYLTGEAQWEKWRLRVTADTLIPRPETAELVEWVKQSWTEKTTLAVDVGTGSGNIALALAAWLKAQNMPGKILALDQSPAALKVAHENALAYRLASKIDFKRSDLLEALDRKRLSGDWLLVANLPYIPTRDYWELDENVRNYEPRTALDGGEDGWYFYAMLLMQATLLNVPPQQIFLEVDPSHDESFLDIYTEYEWERRRDSGGLWRFWHGLLITSD